MRLRLRLGLGLGLTLALGALPAAAQTPAAARGLLPDTLTFDAALELARANSPDYRRALADVDAASAAERAGLAAFLPQLDASVSLGGSQNRQITGTNDYGETIRRDDPVTYTSSSTSQRVGLGVTLFQGGARFAELSAARDDRSAAVADARTALARVRGDVAMAYWQALYDRGQAALEARLLAGARERLDATRRLLEVGARDPLDVLGARADLAREAQEAARARGQFAKDRLALAEAMGVGGPGDFALPDAALPVFDPDALDGESLVREALSANPELTALRARTEAAGARVADARAARWPTLRASADYVRSQGANDYSALFEPNPLNHGFSFGLSLSVPVFDGFQTGSRIAQAEAGRIVAMEAERARSLQVEHDARATLVDLENEHAGVQLADTSAALARERVEMAQERYRAGGLGFTELQQVIDQAAQAERSALAARMAFAQALVRLERLVARPLR